MEEQVAKFLHIIGHDVKNQSVSFFFSTIWEYIRNVLNVILMMEGEFLNQQSRSDVQPHILNNNRFYPYFKVIV